MMIDIADIQISVEDKYRAHEPATTTRQGNATQPNKKNRLMSSKPVYYGIAMRGGVAGIGISAEACDDDTQTRK